MPPNLEPRSGGKHSAFVHRAGIIDESLGTFLPGHEFGRGPTGRTARYMRTYMLGSGAWQAQRAKHPPNASIAPHMAAAVSSLQSVLSVFAPPTDLTEDGMIYGAASIVVSDFAEARAAALSNPLVHRYGRIMLASRAARYDSGRAMACSVLTMLMAAMAAAATAVYLQPATGGTGRLPAPSLMPTIAGIAADAHDVLDAGTPLLAATSMHLFLVFLPLIIYAIPCAQANGRVIANRAYGPATAMLLYTLWMLYSMVSATHRRCVRIATRITAATLRALHLWASLIIGDGLLASFLAALVGAHARRGAHVVTAAVAAGHVLVDGISRDDACGAVAAVPFVTAGVLHHGGGA